MTFELQPAANITDGASLLVSADAGNGVLLGWFGETHEAAKLTVPEAKRLIGMLWQAVAVAADSPPSDQEAEAR